MRAVPILTIGAARLLHICQSGSGVTASDCGSAVTLSANAAVVIWSVGANATSGGKSVHEAQNPNPNGGSVDNVFVSRSHSDVEEHEFDDLVFWIPATTVLSRFMSAGHFTPSGAGAISPIVEPAAAR